LPRKNFPQENSQQVFQVKNQTDAGATQTTSATFPGAGIRREGRLRGLRYATRGEMTLKWLKRAEGCVIGRSDEKYRNVRKSKKNTKFY